ISDLNMSTLTLKKTLIVIQEGFSEGSTGRNILFEQAVDIIKDGFIPRGIGYYKAFTDYDYPHNIFLDLFIIFGYLSIRLVVVSIIAIIYYFKRETFILRKDIVLMVLTASVIRLLLSSTFLQEISLWMVIGLMIFKRPYIANQK